MSKLLIIAMNYAPEIAGCGVYAGDLGMSMSRRGHDVHVISGIPHYPGWRVLKPYFNRYRQETYEGANVCRCPLLLHTPMSGIWRLLAPLSFALTSFPVVFWKIFTKQPNTILLVEPTLFAAPLMLLAAKIIKARTVLHVQDLEIDAAFAMGHIAMKTWLYKLAILFERTCLMGFDQIITISSKMAQRLAEKGVTNERIYVVRNWVDLDHIKPLGRSNVSRDELNLPHHAFVVLYSGNLGPKQGLDIVIDAARLLREEKAIIFVIAGEGPSKAHLEKCSSDLENVRFLSFQPYEKLGEFLAASDLHILPQRAKVADLVLPSKLGPMLASGRPIVVTAESKTELAECLEGIAMIVPPENALALAQAIRTTALSAHSGSISKGLSFANELARPTAMDRFENILFKENFRHVEIIRSVSTPSASTSTSTCGTHVPLDYYGGPSKDEHDPLGSFQ